MFISKTKKLNALKTQLYDICKENGYTIDGKIDFNTPFSIITPNKKYNIAIISSYRFKDSGIRFFSETTAFVWANVMLLQGLFGRITFPLNKTIKLPELEDDGEKLFVVFPGVNVCQIMSTEGKQLTWHAGMKLGNAFVLDGASLREELKNPGAFTEEKIEKHSAVVSAVGC